MNKLKEKNHMSSSLDAIKTFEKLQHPFMLKVLERDQEYKDARHIHKAIYRKSIAHIKLDG